ncbi:MAG: hypothetical protein B7Y95_03870, partial [Rhizobiales bacterium 32-66-11]
MPACPPPRRAEPSRDPTKRSDRRPDRRSDQDHLPCAISKPRAAPSSWPRRAWRPPPIRFPAWSRSTCSRPAAMPWTRPSPPARCRAWWSRAP